MPNDLFSEALKFVAGVATALTTVWAARVMRGGTLAETLRQEQADIREWLKQQLDEVRAEHQNCNTRLTALSATLDAVRGLLRLAVEHRASELPFDIEMAAALAKLEQNS